MTGAAAMACPTLGWAEMMITYADKGAKLPVEFSATASDCDVHEWSWEAFTWATAMEGGKPRFMQLHTMEELAADYAPRKGGLMRVIARSSKAHSLPHEEYAAAFTEADGSMLVGQNGYPVYATVHMNDSYFRTVRQNMIKTGAYQRNAGKDVAPPAGQACDEADDRYFFRCGAAVFKATWYRLADGEKPPEGAYHTVAEVPVLANRCDEGGCVAVATDKHVQARVALVGLHVAGYVEHHPEFLWATFEHHRNAPSVPDGTFAFDGRTIEEDYTFYKAGTPFTKDKVLVPNQPANSNDPALLTFHEETQTFSPVTQVVQMNRTGGENHADGAANIESLNAGARAELRGQNSWAASYFLLGTVWMKPDWFTADNPEITSKTFKWQNHVRGSAALANTTAETFMQAPSSPGNPDTMNCFDCHNPQSYSYSGKPMPNRRVAISHMLAVDTPFAVPNKMPVKDKGSLGQ